MIMNKDLRFSKVITGSVDPSITLRVSAIFLGGAAESGGDTSHLLTFYWRACLGYSYYGNGDIGYLYDGNRHIEVLVWLLILWQW